VSESHEVFEREVFIAASPEIVFVFLVDPALMAEWFGLSHILEPKPGGTFRVDCSHGNIVVGVYTEVIPYRRVAFTWGWESENEALASLKPGASLVEIELEPREGGTLLHLRHSNLPGNLKAVHGEHWSADLATLARAAAKREKRRAPKTTK